MDIRDIRTYSFAKTPLNAAQAPLAMAYIIHCERGPAGVGRGSWAMGDAFSGVVVDCLPWRWRTILVLWEGDAERQRRVGSWDK